MLLTGQVAVVTGSSRGIGKAIVIALARQGAKVIVNYHGSQEAAGEVVDHITSSGGVAKAVRADVAQSAGAEFLLKEAISEYGRIDILVNNAGVTKDNLLLRLKDQDWEAVLTTNLTGVFNCTKSALKFMMKKKSGRIINISSVIGLTGNAGQANYAAAKAGIIGFTKAVAKEVGTRNILVNAIAPGYIETDMTAGLSPEVKEKLLQTIPLGRLGNPDDVAEVVVFLASSAAKYITGQVITVDGGMVM